jgi:hypothetical protein
VSTAVQAATVTCEVAATLTTPSDARGRGVRTAYRLDDGSLIFMGRLRVDADGAPRAYHPQQQRGLDRLDNAGHAGDWWGIATNTRDHEGDPNCAPHGKPVVQGPHDPAPGFYVSTTTMMDPRVEDCRRQRAYVDADAINYVALPRKLAAYDARHHAGPLAMVVNTRNEKRAGAVLADEAPPTGFGEGSIALARRLGYRPSPRDGGTEARDAFYLVFTDTQKFPHAEKVVDDAAAAAFARWGGDERLAVCRKALAKLPR